MQLIEYTMVQIIREMFSDVELRLKRKQEFRKYSKRLSACERNSEI